MSGYFPLIERYQLPHDAVFEIVRHLRSDGLLGNEGILFLAGAIKGGFAEVTTIFVPTGPDVVKQPYFCSVSDEIINSIGSWMNPPQRVLLMQVHSHKSLPHHSPTDDRWCFKSPGFVSVVVNRFAADDPPDPYSWAFHECDSAGRFRRWPLGETHARISFLHAPVRTVEVNADGPAAV